MTLVDHELIRRAVKAVSRMGLRKAGLELGVSHETVRRWRVAVKAGAEEDITVSPDVRAKVEEYLGAIPARASHGYADGVRFSLAKVEAVAAELREILGDTPGGIADYAPAQIRRAAGIARSTPHADSQLERLVWAVAYIEHHTAKGTDDQVAVWRSFVDVLTEFGVYDPAAAPTIGKGQQVEEDPISEKEIPRAG